MQREKEKICMFVLEESVPILERQLSSHLESAFHRKIELTKMEINLDFAYHPKRGQYNSSDILARLRMMKNKECERLLTVVDVDLYVPELNFVFGEADSQNGVAVISTRRLGEEFYGLPGNPQIFLDRVIKEAVHELGHTYGLPHCPDPRCVMHFSNSLKDTDFKGSSFCDACQKKLELLSR